MSKRSPQKTDKPLPLQKVSQPLEPGWVEAPDGRIFRLSSAHQKTIAQGRDASGMGVRRDFSKKMSKERDAAIKRWYREGGQWFIDWVKEHYRRWDGEPLHWREPFQEEFYLLMGNPLIERVIVEKGSQMGFSEELIAQLSFTLAALKLPTALGFEAELKLRDMVPRIQTGFDYCEPIQKARKRRRSATGRKDTDHKERKISVEGVECTFFYTSTAAKSGGQERQASSAMSSFTAWVLFGDELELWSSSGIDVATERQSACEMVTKPFRGGSTPGQEGGIIDTQIRSSKHVFQWHLICPHCEQAQFLHPFGNLLKAVLQESEDGSQEERFIDITGRPLDWFYHDGSSRDLRVSTAYLGCQNCAKELDQAAIATGEFRCRNTGISLRALCDYTLSSQTPIFETVSLRLPRLASILFNAPERVRKLINTRNPVDQLQQGLGLSVSVGGGKISLIRLQRCVGLPLPSDLGSPDLVVMGVDQGKAHNWGIVEYWWLAKADDPEERWLNAHKQVVWWGAVVGFDAANEAGYSNLDDLVAKYGVDLVGIDADPETSAAGTYARRHPPEAGKKGQVFLLDQVILKGQDFRRKEMDVQKTVVPAFSIDRTAWLDSVRNSIYQGRHHFPEGLVYEAGEDSNLLYHYLTSDRRSDGTWLKVPGAPDHFMHADNFAHACVLISLYEPKPGGFVFSSFKRT